MIAISKIILSKLDKKSYLCVLLVIIFLKYIMKSTKFIAFAAAALALASCAQAPKVDAPAPSSSEVDSVSYLMGVNFGYFIKANNFADRLSDINMIQVKKGMQDFINATGNMGSEEFNASFKISPDMMNEVFNNFIAKRTEYKAAVNAAEGKAYLEKIAKKDGIIKTESGLLYQIIEDGNEVKAAATDTVWCQYKGTLIDGSEFDSADSDVQFTLDRVIPAWTEGMQLVGEGGHIILYVPSELGYGERGAGPKIGPNSTLIFDVTISKVGKKAVEEKTEE